jgi:hypothetical protein
LLCGLESMWEKISRPIWRTMLIRSDDGNWCLDQIWGDIWIGTHDNGCCTDQIYSAMWIGNYVAGSIHDKFEVLCGLEQMI